MKKLLNMLKYKGGLVNMMNLCAMAVVICSVNATCFWVHHQPEVPEEAKRFRKF